MTIAIHQNAPQFVFAAMELTKGADVAHSAPSETPKDWSDALGADSFVFRSDVTNDVTTAQFA